MVLALCTSSDGSLSMYKFHIIPFYTFRDMLRTSFLLQKIKKGSNSINTGDRVMVLDPEIPLMALYQCIFIKLPSILLEICFGPTDRRTVRQSGDYMLSLREAYLKGGWFGLLNSPVNIIKVMSSWSVYQTTLSSTDLVL